MRRLFACRQVRQVIMTMPPDCLFQTKFFLHLSESHKESLFPLNYTSPSIDAHLLKMLSGRQLERDC